MNNSYSQSFEDLITGLGEIKDHDVYLYCDSEYYVGVCSQIKMENVHIGTIDANKYIIFPQLENNHTELEET